MRVWVFTALLLCVPGFAHAGAWTQERGRWQVITDLILSTADHTYGSSAPVQFRRALLQLDAEYGLRDNVTLFTVAESAYVDIRQGGAPFRTIDNAVQGGVRWRMDPWLRLSGLGVFSLEASVRTAGAFNFAVSANRSSGGNGAQLRLLYGRSFKLWGHDAYVDLEAGESLLSGGRPAETPLDFAAGFSFDRNNLAMLQSFNLFAGAGRLGAYPSFESHKLQLTWVRRMSRHFLLQAGGFFSPAGRNALDEQGLCLSLWTRF